MKNIHISLLTLILFIQGQPSEGKTIAYLYALEEDNRSFKDAGASLIRTESVGDRTLRTYRLAEHTIISVLLSSGQTESAVSTEMILARRAVDSVISTGVVGAIDETYKIGDIILINNIIGWQTGSHGVNGWTETPRTRPIVIPWRTDVLPWPKTGTASGDVFVASESERARINSLSGMPVIDMNLFGVQTAINAHHRPALHLRIVSDRAGDNASEEFRQFAASYKGQLGHEVAKLIKSLPKDLESPASYPGIKALEPKP